MRYNLNDLIKSKSCEFEFAGKKIYLIDVLKKLVIIIQKAFERYREDINLKFIVSNNENIEDCSDINQILEIFERMNILISTYHKSKVDDNFISFQSKEKIFLDYIHRMITRVCEIEKYLRIASLIDEIELINKSFKIEYKNNKFYQELVREYKLSRDKIQGYIERIETHEYERFSKDLNDLPLDLDYKKNLCPNGGSLFGGFSI